LTNLSRPDSSPSSPTWAIFLAPGLPEFDDLCDDVDSLVGFVDVAEHPPGEPTSAPTVAGQSSDVFREVGSLKIDVSTRLADERPDSLVRRHAVGTQSLQLSGHVLGIEGERGFSSVLVGGAKRVGEGLYTVLRVGSGYTGHCGTPKLHERDSRPNPVVVSTTDSSPALANSSTGERERTAARGV
jgi:hypothetical protein